MGPKPRRVPCCARRNWSESSIAYIASDSFYARCVRSGQAVSPFSFTDNADETITHNNTGLMWQKNDDGITKTWDQAIGYCEGLIHAGVTDWRLPNIKELESIIDFSLIHPAIDKIYFPNVQSSGYWSSTTMASNGGSAFLVNFDDGSFRPSYDKSNTYYYVRCVRGGQ